MKKIIFLICFVCAVCQLGAQNNTKLTIDLNKYILSAKVRIVGNGIADEMSADKSKVVSFSLPVKEAGFFKLYIDLSAHDLYLEPDSDLNIKVVPTEGEVFNLMHLSLDFSGKTAKVNNYLNTCKLNLMSDADFLMDEAAYIEKIEKVNKDNIKLIKSYKLDKHFEKNELFRAKYKLYEALTRYPVQHYWKDGNQAYVLYKSDDTPVVNDYIVKQFIDTEEAWRNDAYRTYVNNAIGILALDDFKQDWDLTMTRRLNVLTKYFTTPCILEDMVQKMAIIYVEGTQGKPLEVLQRPYDKYVKKQEYKDKLQQTYKAWQNFQAGEKLASADAVYVDASGKEVSFEQLKGKYVYIDVWATWCGPCRAEIPYLKKLEEQFKGRNIEFVSISIDMRKSDWAKMVKEQGMTGNQWYGGANAPIVVDYKINGIPRFLLLDRDGNMLNSNMSRPSDINTKGDLEQLQGI